MLAATLLCFALLSFGQEEGQGRRQLYYAVDYTLHHISLDPMLLRNFSTGYPEAGHMMYIDEKSLSRMRADSRKVHRRFATQVIQLERG